MKRSPLLAVATLVATLAVVPASNAVAGPAVTAAGSTTPLAGYHIQSTSVTSDTGATISQPGYAHSGWVPAAARSTVLAALLAAGRYSDPFFSTNMQSIPTSDFTVPWWYRSEFTLDSSASRTYLDFSGVISKADVFVNGTQVATNGTITGAYPHYEIDVTAQVHSGVNAVAFKVYPNNPNANLTIGWIDWLQVPRDNNMGIFRDVLIRRNGGVALRGGHVLVSLNGSLTSATLTAKVDARNDSGAATTQTIGGTVAGIPISANVSLAAGERKTVTFPAVTLTNPQVWWPAGMGGQPLYDLILDSPTDGVREKFGVRSVTATLDGSGHRSYKVNGKPLLIKGGGWSPDVFLRWDPTYVEDRIKYVLDLGLNTIRLEGHLEPDEFFQLTDQYGVLVLPGWECCDKWEGQVNGGEPGDTWTSADFPVATASMKAEAERLRNHPSVISFLIGSDFAPNATIEQNYVNALTAADWPTPIIAAASDTSAPITGASGMKMTGPYDWVPPNYWYNKREGGAFGFNSETSAGPDVPTLDTLQRMMTASQLNTLWQNPTSTQYHRSPSSTFNNLGIFNNAIIGRYGTASSLNDYVLKAQLQQYENVRAQFEAYGRNFTDGSNPSTGVIYWMLNSGWTSLHWQLFDRYLDQNGSYFGAKKANEPLHIQYSYDNKSVVVVNNRNTNASGLSATVKVFNTDGTEKFTNTTNSLAVNGLGGKTAVLTIPSISGLTATYLVKLTLSEGGQEVSRNVYWLSTAADVIDYANNQWYYAPTTSYANLKGLSNLGSATLSATASTTAAGSDSTTSVTLTNAGTKIAFFTDAHIVRANGTPVLPAQWTDNEVSLWPGESATLTAKYRTADLQGSAPSVRVQGWNVASTTIPAVPDNTAPSTPANLHTTSVGSAAVALAWDAATDNVGVTGYDVYRDGAPRGTSPGTTFTDSVAPATAYTYTVRARDGAGNTSGFSAPVTVTTPSGPARLEAENATISQGVVEANHLNFSGTGFVNYDNVTGSYVDFTVTGPVSQVSIRYANGTTTNRPMSVNGVTVDFPGTGNWDTWATATIPLSLGSGTQHIRLTATTANGGPNLDFIEVVTAPPPSRLEAEDAMISQGVVEANHLNFSGTGFVNCDNVVGSFVQWGVASPAGGTVTLKIRYANGTTTNRPADIIVNGTTIVAGQAFPSTTNWDTWANVTLTVNLTAGVNTIRVVGTTANGPANLDYIEVS
jgi:exo-1,4-beta-D-glucosaminidase